MALPFALPFVVSPLVKKLWKPVGLLLLAGVALWGFLAWKDNLKDEAWAAGFAEAEAQFQVKVAVANTKVAEKQNSINQFAGIFEMMANKEIADVNVKVQPILKEVQDEVAQNPLYSDCRVSDGMLDRLNAGRATVDKAIGSTNPRVN